MTDAGDRHHRRRTSFKDVVNDAIRRGLAPQARTGEMPPYRVRPHRTTLRPGIDPAGFNRLVDEIEDEAVIEKATSGR